MKKILLASTALVMSAGVAAADVAVSGDGRMGIIYDGAKATNKTSFTSRVRVAFTLSGETDGGLAFGGSIRADNAVGGAAGTAGSVFIKGAFGTLTMGDTNGAVEARNGDLAGVGLTGLGDLNEFTYLSNAAAGRPTARYDYTIEGFTVSISHTNPGVGAKVGSIGASYAFEGFTFGLGAERANATGAVAATPSVCSVGGALTLVAAGTACGAGNVTLVAGTPARAAVGSQTHVVVSAGYSFDGIGIKAMYGRLSTSGVAAKQSQYGLSATGSFDALSVSAFGRRDFAKDTHIGIGAAYDLGGGASLRGGIVNTNFNAVGVKSRTQADLGLAFTF